MTVFLTLFPLSSGSSVTYIPGMCSNLGSFLFVYHPGNFACISDLLHIFTALPSAVGSSRTSPCLWAFSSASSCARASLSKDRSGRISSSSASAICSNNTLATNAPLDWGKSTTLTLYDSPSTVHDDGSVLFPSHHVLSLSLAQRIYSLPIALIVFVDFLPCLLVVSLNNSLVPSYMIFISSRGRVDIWFPLASRQVICGSGVISIINDSADSFFHKVLLIDLFVFVYTTSASSHVTAWVFIYSCSSFSVNSKVGSSSGNKIVFHSGVWRWWVFGVTSQGIDIINTKEYILYLIYSTPFCQKTRKFCWRFLTYVISLFLNGHTTSFQYIIIRYIASNKSKIHFFSIEPLW